MPHVSPGWGWGFPVTGALEKSHANVRRFQSVSLQLTEG